MHKYSLQFCLLYSVSCSPEHNSGMYNIWPYDQFLDDLSNGTCMPNAMSDLIHLYLFCKTHTSASEKGGEIKLSCLYLSGSFDEILIFVLVHIAPDRHI